MEKDKILYKGWLTVIDREIDGVHREIVTGKDGKDSDAVAAIIFNEHENKILLVKQKRYAVRGEDKWTWEIPAGMMDVDGESPEDCLVREIQEETGIELDAAPIYLLNYYGILGHDTHRIFLYCAGAKENSLPELVNDADVTEAKWFELREVEHMINTGIIKDGKTMIAFYRMAQSVNFALGLED